METTGTLLVPCPICGHQVPVAISFDDVRESWVPSDDLVGTVSLHVIDAHNQPVSGH